uniref:Uncharacterized protein n=1 Tax=Timema poppense TaxID=170557 RepID=A0A7R9D508_TIMPO|nr:unnamed protein product [Timema poppensis]
MWFNSFPPLGDVFRHYGENGGYGARTQTSAAFFEHANLAARQPVFPFSEDVLGSHGVATIETIAVKDLQEV